MKTSELIADIQKAVDGYGAINTAVLIEAAERLQQLSTGSHGFTADVALEVFSHRELANMYDIRAHYTQDLYDENKRLSKENAKLKDKCERLEKRLKSIRSRTGVWF